MTVIAYKNGKEFLEACLPELLMNEAASQFLIVNARHNQDVDLSNEAFFGKVVNGFNESVLFFGKVEPFNLVCFLSGKTVSYSAIKELCLWMDANDYTINGINTSMNICEPFMKAYSSIRKASFKLHLAMDIMAIESLKEIDLVQGSSRPSTSSDMPLIYSWMAEFNQEALGEKTERDAFERRHAQSVENGSWYIFYNERNEPVSLAASTRATIHSASVNAVYTPSGERGKGYACANVYYLTRDLLRKHRFCTLFVDKSNPISNRLYRKIGYETVIDCYDYCVIK